MFDISSCLGVRGGCQRSGPLPSDSWTACLEFSVWPPPTFKNNLFFSNLGKQGPQKFVKFKKIFQFYYIHIGRLLLHSYSFAFVHAVVGEESGKIGSLLSDYENSDYHR